MYLHENIQKLVFKEWNSIRKLVYNIQKLVFVSWIVLYLYDIQNFISVFLKFDKHITSYALKQVIKILECNRF